MQSKLPKVLRALRHKVCHKLNILEVAAQYRGQDSSLSLTPLTFISRERGGYPTVCMYMVSTDLECVIT